MSQINMASFAQETETRGIGSERRIASDVDKAGKSRWVGLDGLRGEEPSTAQKSAGRDPITDANIVRCF